MEPDRQRPRHTAAMLSRSATEPPHNAVSPCSPQSPHQKKLLFLRQHDSLLHSPPSTDTDGVGGNENQDAAESSDAQQKIRPRFTIDPEGSLTHDKTTVDIVAVPCPGGHPLRSWSRDGLMSRYYGALSMRVPKVKEDADRRPSPSWVRQGIRREADCARILLYEHPEAEEVTTLSLLADTLLHELQQLRESESRRRPVLFIGHSVGGLVVKMALAKARRDVRYKNILRECYGVAFFGTPHQGSSYFAMPGLANSISSLLQLSRPLPKSITDDLRVGNSLLAHIDEEFRAASHDLLVWTFYETIDSRLLGGSATGSDSRDVYITVPLTSTKSAILGMRQERIFPLQSDHANIASFGRHDAHTMRMFLKQLAHRIGHADANIRADEMGNGRWKLELEQKVAVEVHGFFDDPPTKQGNQVVEEPSIVRAWSTRLPLREFLVKGPEVCLSERLNEVKESSGPESFVGRHERTGPVKKENGVREDAPAANMPVAVPSPDFLTVQNALGIKDMLSSTGFVASPGSPVIWAVDTLSFRQPPPGASLDRQSEPPTRAISPESSPMRAPSPLIRADFEQDMAVDRLSPPLRGRMGRSVSRSFSMGNDGSRVENLDFPSFPQRSQSALVEGVAYDEEDGLEASPRLPPEAVVAIRKTAKGSNGQQGGETVIVDGVAIAFATPDVKRRKFLWMHVPFNNPAWVKSVLQTLEVSFKKDYSALYGQDFWMTRHTRGRHAQHYAHHAKPGCYFSDPQTLSPRNRFIINNNQSSSPPPSGAGDSMFICLFLPYLHFDSYKRLIQRRDLIIKRLSQGRAHPVPASVAKSDSLELQVIWDYLGHDPPLNCRRTLHQYSYPSLRDTRSRDDDQMLYKLTKERIPHAEGKHVPFYKQSSSNAAASDLGTTSQPSSGSSSIGWRDEALSRDRDEYVEEDEVLNGNVLMVDQLWLWVLQSHTVLSFFSKRESDPIEGPLYQQADLRDSIFNEVNVDLTRQCENALDLAALAALHAVSVLLDRASHPDLEIFRIFEEAISLLTEKLTSSLKDFQAEGLRDKACDYEPVDDGARSIRKRHREEGRRAERENRDNTSALLELRDIEDELQMLLHLFERQSKVIMSMYSIYNRPEVREKSVNGRGFLNEAMKRLGEYAQQISEMMQRVRATRDEYDKLLQMVQRQAQVDEVRLSRLHTDLASAQSRSVMIFTTFTVIFLPLTFFTGLFGMNTHEWGGGNNLSLKSIGIIALPTSAFLVISSLVIAFSTNARRIFRWVGRKYRHFERWMYFYAWGPVIVELLEIGHRIRGKSDGEDREGRTRTRRGRLETEVSDFWDRNRRERDRGYKIPEVNKMRRQTTGR